MGFCVGHGVGLVEHVLQALFFSGCSAGVLGCVRHCRVLRGFELLVVLVQAPVKHFLPEIVCSHVHGQQPLAVLGQLARGVTRPAHGLDVILADLRLNLRREQRAHAGLCGGQFGVHLLRRGHVFLPESLDYFCLLVVFGPLGAQQCRVATANRPSAAATQVNCCPFGALQLHDKSPSFHQLNAQVRAFGLVAEKDFQFVDLLFGGVNLLGKACGLLGGGPQALGHQVEFGPKVHHAARCQLDGAVQGFSSPFNAAKRGNAQSSTCAATNLAPHASAIFARLFHGPTDHRQRPGSGVDVVCQRLPHAALCNFLLEREPGGAEPVQGGLHAFGCVLPILFGFIKKIFRIFRPKLQRLDKAFFHVFVELLRCYAHGLSSHFKRARDVLPPLPTDFFGHHLAL